ncbi:class I SAM-dependent methyltransferase [Rubrobacter tropicus]|uniref:class I SAM-dependent methyltransferase n=1 Tax=Rubrobacter tropicus TaxID=2653851 RepID=UPI00140BEE36|nr:class I SAM-dependent methyltransferase [Rubrobacter tropicus]
MSFREKWDGIFSRPGDEPGDEDAWLERWRGLLEADREAPILDLGCGAGYDARTLTRWGFRVVAADFSEKALERTSRLAPKAETKNVDLTRGLPFADSSFGAIVASLSLHYFPWQKTEEILEDARRCLTPDRHLLARLNSTSDAHYTAAQKEEIEPNFYLVDGHPKRLFDRQSVDALFARGWHPVGIAERTTNPYGGEKTLWEIVARKQHRLKARPAKRAEAR